MSFRNLIRNYPLPAAIALTLAFLLAAGGLLPPANAEAATALPPAGPEAREQSGPHFPYDVIVVTGTGKTPGVPDLAHLSLGVSATADTVAAAREEAAKAMASVLVALKNNGVANADIMTSHFDVWEDYDYNMGERKFIGYVVSNGVNVKVRDTDAVGTVIDAAIAAGGNNIKFNGLRFSFSDTSAMEQTARVAAVQNMEDKAQQLAEAAGRELGELKMLTELSGVPVVFQEAFREFAADAVTDTPIQAGEDEVIVIVYGVYELR